MNDLAARQMPGQRQPLRSARLGLGKAGGDTRADLGRLELQFELVDGSVQPFGQLFIDYDLLDSYERNTLRFLFLNEFYRTLIVNGEGLAREMMGTFRAARARAKDKVTFDELVEELSSKSREFVLWWPNLDVKNFGEGYKRLQHPKLGLVDLSYVALSPHERPELSLVTYVRK